MKRIILGAFISAISLSVLAQTNTKKIAAGNYTDQVSTNEQIRQMAVQLQLNEGRYIQFREINKARASEVSDINSLYANDAAVRQSKLDAVNKQYDVQLAQALTISQFNAYLQAVGRTSEVKNNSLKAAGYGGRSIESEGTPVNKPTTTENNNTDTSDNSSINSFDNVKVESNNVIVESDAGDLKINQKGEKVETKEIIYKADADETKLKAKDESFKAKSEEGKTKIETPEGKIKIEDGETKIKPKRGKKVKIKD